MSVASLAEVEAMGLDEYDAWYRFFRNHLARLRVEKKG